MRRLWSCLSWLDLMMLQNFSLARLLDSRIPSLSRRPYQTRLSKPLRDSMRAYLLRGEA